MGSLILPGDGASLDPWTSRYTASAWGVPFDVPGISCITDNIHVGGCYPGMVLPEGFVHVVSLHSPGFEIPEGHGATVTSAVMDDDVDKPVDAFLVKTLARVVLDNAEVGPVLVHCQMGINRSAMVVAAALIMKGYTPERAIRTIRNARPGTLSNWRFCQFLATLSPGSLGS